MTDLLNKSSQLSYSGLQKEYDALTEEIQFLRHRNKTDDLTPRQEFRLRKQIEEAEAEREQIAQQLTELESTSSAVDKNLYRILLRLGYRQQIRLFRRLMETDSVAAFLIHGYPDYGQRWLLNRLVIQYVPKLLTGKIIKVNVGRKVRRNDVSALWREVAGRVGLRGKQASPAEIAKEVCRCLQTQNVLLVFHEIDTMPETSLGELLHEFWQPLVSEVQNSQCQLSSFKLLMFLVDYEGCVDDWEVPFVDKLNASWGPQMPIKAPMITEFSDDDLIDWIETEYDKLPTVLTTKVDNTVQKILENSDDGIPELALEAICHHCGYDWYEESEKWLKL